MGYIYPLFDSLFSVATPGKESRQLAPYNLNHSTRRVTQQQYRMIAEVVVLVIVFLSLLYLMRYDFVKSRTD